MTRIVALLPKTASSAKAAFQIHAISGAPISLIRENPDAGTPFADFRRFENNHGDISNTLQALISKSSEIGKIRFFELPDDELFHASLQDNEEISYQELINILDAFNAELERQNRLP